MAPGRIPFQELDPGRTELRRARQGAPSDRPVPRAMASLP